MQITNLNIFSIWVFLIFIWIIWYLLIKKIKNQLIFNKTYPLLKSKKYFYIKYIFLFLALFFVSLSIFKIKINSNAVWITTNWINIIFTLDVSKSMNVADFSDENYYYSRLDLVKNNIKNFIKQNPNNKYWLVIFAWEAIWSIPLTDDFDLFLSILNQVDYKNLTVQWSDFVSAISMSKDRFLEDNKSNAVIFISDGWDNDDKIDVLSLEKLKKEKPNINYFTVGVWSENWGKIVLWSDFIWRNVYQQDSNWNDVISKLNIANLEKISSSLKADFIQIKDLNSMLELNKYIKKIETKLLKKEIWANYLDISRYLSFLSFLSFLCYLWLYFLNDKIWKKS